MPFSTARGGRTSSHDQPAGGQARPRGRDLLRDPRHGADYDCWHPDHDHVTAEQILGVLGRNAETARAVLRAAVRRLPIPRGCECAKALKYALITPPELVPEAVKRELEPIVGRYMKRA